MPTKIDDKGVDIKDWLFKGLQMLVVLFMGYYINTNNETQKNINQTQKEILGTLGQIREQIAVERKEKEYMIKDAGQLNTRIEKVEDRVTEIERRTSGWHK